MRFIAMAIGLLLCSCGKDRNSREREAELRPVIQYVDAFIGTSHRLPTDQEFQEAARKHGWNGTALVIRDKAYPYAASHGAKSNLDYMAGAWRADWYHYYKSWDKQFINASDE